MSRFWAGRALKRVRQRLAGRLVRGQWQLALRYGPSEAPALTLNLDQFRTLRPPSDRFWADPFPVCEGDRCYLFFEELQFADYTGYLMVAPLGPEGLTGPPVRILGEVSHHLSWPYVFKWQGNWYLMPESQNVGSVMIYRSRAFPLEWEPYARVLDAPVVDANLLEHEGRWWLFACGAPVGEPPCEELYIYHGPTPLGPWTPHRLNPVKRDVRSSRPAGRIFKQGDYLYRPVQDCSKRYGWQVKVCRILRLDLEGFEEEVSAVYRPGEIPGALGIHTVNFSNGHAALDLERARISLRMGLAL
jgi:hypothetical protein